MQTASPAAATGGPLNLLRRAEAWLDDRGRMAWIATMVLGFVVFWPVGLALLGFMIVTRRFNGSTFRKDGDFRMFCRHRNAGHPSFNRAAFRSSGNSAFDAYKAETLKRLEDEQQAFEGFLQRLRDAKDKQEFDSFMDDRARRAAQAPEGEPQA